ncbi:MAG: cellulase family glycosylhydrolase [Rhizobiaceae bacterium]|nr:cellulase family glycosylhydrolase [Rhizobiaceae bacterium]
MPAPVRRRHVLLLAILILIVAGGGRAISAACPAPEGFPNPALLETMQRGVNLPGWDHPDPAMRPTIEQLRAVRDDGFTHIRLLVERPPLSDEAAPAFAEALFEQIVLLLSLGYTVTVDLHAGHLAEPYLRAGPDEAQAFLTAIWRRMAPAIRVFGPDKVAVELLNEPPTDSATWRTVSAGLIADIRRWLPERTIVASPSGPQRHEDLAGMEPFSDRNIVYAVHYYDPFLFTHQGANWGSPDDPLQHFANLPFPAELSDQAVQANIAALRENGLDAAAAELAYALSDPWAEEGIEAAFGMMAEWGERHQRPVVVNEFGALTFVAPRESRLEWLAAVGRQAAAHCIGWTHWDFQDGFGLIDPDTGMPDPGVVQALIPAPTQDY